MKSSMFDFIRKSLFLFILFPCLLIFCRNTEGRRSIQLDQNLTEEINHLLKNSDELHMSFFDQNEEKIAAALNKTLKQISSAQASSLKIEEHSRSHLNKILDAVKSHLELTQTTSGETRRENLKSAFEQLAHLTRIYKVDTRYRIFFCPKDRSSWIQVGWKAKNPINPETLAHCGKAVK